MVPAGGLRSTRGAYPARVRPQSIPVHFRDRVPRFASVGPVRDDPARHPGAPQRMDLMTDSEPGRDMALVAAALALRLGLASPSRLETAHWARDADAGPPLGEALIDLGIVDRAAGP